jgi:membrane protease YdiL (CAAX protease family)
VDDQPQTPAASTRRGAWVAVGYFGLYLGSLFVTLESERMHWLTLVLFPLILVVTFQPRGDRSVSAVMATLGFRRGNLGRGLWWAMGLGLVISVLQVWGSERAAAVQELVLSGKALWMFPLTFVLMLVTAGFTEEFFFRGYLQPRVAVLVRSKWLAVVVVALCFGVYHLPYAYLNPRWPSTGDWGLAWVAAMGNGVPGGLVLGALYVLTRGNTLACVVLHSMINAVPAMTMIRFSGG